VRACGGLDGGKAREVEGGAEGNREKGKVG